MFYFVLIFIIILPLGYGFWLATYLKAHADAAPSSFSGDSPEQEEKSSEDRVLDMIHSSDLAQDLVMSKTQKMDPIAKRSSVSEGDNEGAMNPEAPEPISEDAVEEEKAEPEPDSVSPSEGYEPEKEDEFGSLNEHDDLLARAMSTLGNVDLSESPDPEKESEILPPDFDFEALKKQSEPVEEPAAEQEKKVPEKESETLPPDFDFEALKKQSEPVEEPAVGQEENVPEEESETLLPKISRDTFKNVEVFESVPEEFCDSILCLEEENIEDPRIQNLQEIYDLIPAVPEELVVNISADPPEQNARFTQISDARIEIHGKKQKSSLQSDAGEDRKTSAGE